MVINNVTADDNKVGIESIRNWMIVWIIVGRAAMRDWIIVGKAATMLLINVVIAVVICGSDCTRKLLMDCTMDGNVVVST